MIVAGSEIGTTSSVCILLGGDAGLRAGEMRALRWIDVDVDAGRLRVEHSEWRGHITTTKGERVRYVPMTSRLREALQRHRHLRSPQVLTRPDGTSMTEPALKEGLPRGVAPSVIQNLAGHSDLSTTQRYMHVLEEVVVDAIRRLEAAAPGPDRWRLIGKADSGI